MFTRTNVLSKSDIRKAILNSLKANRRKQTFCALWNTKTKILAFGPEHERFDIPDYDAYNKGRISLRRANFVADTRYLSSIVDSLYEAINIELIKQ